MKFGVREICDVTFKTTANGQRVGNKVFAKAGITVWVCRNCGHIHMAEKAPAACPVCAHPQAYFEVKANNF